MPISEKSVVASCHQFKLYAILNLFTVFLVQKLLSKNNTLTNYLIRE